MLGDIRRRSMSIRISHTSSPTDWKSDVWIRKVNQLDQGESDSPEYALFKRTFSDPDVSMDAIFPKLSPKGMDIVLETFPERAPRLISLCPDLSVSSFGRLTLENLFSILFKIIEENGEISESTALVAAKRMKESNIQDVLSGFETCPVDSDKKILFSSLDFEIQLIIYGNASVKFQNFLHEFISHFRDRLNSNLNTHLQDLVRSFDRMPKLKWIFLVKLMSQEQLMPFLSFLNQQQFHCVQGEYLRHFQNLIEDHGESELTYWLRRCSNPDLMKFISKLNKLNVSIPLGDYFYIDEVLIQDYLKRTLTKSGYKERKKLVAEMVDSDQFFNVQRFFSLLKDIVASNKCDPKSIRRALLVALQFLKQQSDLAVHLAPTIRKMISTSLSDPAGIKLQGQLKENLQEYQKQQFANDLIDYLQAKILSVSEVVFGYSSFTTTSHLMTALNKSLQGELSTQAKNQLFSFLNKWLHTVATDKEFLTHKMFLTELTRSPEKSQSYKRFVKRLRMKTRCVETALSTSECPSSPLEPIDMEKVMKSRFKKNQKYAVNLNAITLDLKEYALSLFSQIRFVDLVHHDWTRPTSGESAVGKMIDQWNQLSQSVKSIILDESLKSAERKRVIEFFIDLASSLYGRGDFHSSYAIYSGLILSDVDRSQASWKSLARDHKKKKKKLDEYYDSQYNYRSIRQKIKEMAESGMTKACPATTFLGHDLTLIKENVPNIVGNHLSVAKVQRLSRLYSEFYHWMTMNRQTERQRTRSTAVRTLTSMITDAEDPWTTSEKRKTVG